MDKTALNVVSAAGPEANEAAELRKPHEMIVMVPRSKRVTLTGRRIYNALLQVSQARLAATESMPAADYMFEAPLLAILRTTGSSGEDRTLAKRYLKEMRGLEVDWESTAPGDGVKWRGFSMLAEVAIETRNGENWVAWSYPPTIMASLREPQRWARIDLGVLGRLGSYTATALYEICARYRDNPGGVTSRKPVSWWVDALNQAPAGTERREWRKFKNERIKPAIDDINTETDLEIELVEHKQGRTVVEVQFSVRKKRAAPRLRQQTESVDANLILRAESLGIRELKLEGLIKEFGEPLVREKIEVLERRSANSQLRGIENSYSYLRSLLRNESGAGELIDATSSSASVPSSNASAKANQVLPSQAPIALSQHSSENANIIWLNERIASIRDEIRGLDSVQRQALSDAAVQELAGKGLMTAVVTRRAAQGDVLFGILGSTVIRLYASRVYGPDWDKREAGDLFAGES